MRVTRNEVDIRPFDLINTVICPIGFGEELLVTAINIAATDIGYV